MNRVLWRSLLLLVLATGVARGDLLRVPTEYASIGAALTAAAHGDTIEIAPDTYSGPQNRDLDPGGRDIVFRAAGGSGGVIVDCESAGRAFSFVTGETSDTIVEGFTIVNGDGWATAELRGGAVRCVGSAPQFRGCVFQSCEGEFGGAAIMHDSSAEFVDCQFVDNHASVGGAMCIWGASDVTATGTSFIENRGEAGALYMEFSSVQLDGCTFVGNHGSGLSSGITTWGAPGARITRCTFVCQTGRPVVSCAGGSRLVVDSAVFAFNEARPMECDDCESVVTRTLSYGSAVSDSLCGSVSQCLYVDPLFCEAPQTDVSLCADSPCLAENNPWGETIGSGALGCGPCATAVESGSWGLIKEHYR